MKIMAAFRLRFTCGDIQRQSRGKEESLMREYEIIFIVHPELEESALNDVTEKVKGWVNETGGTITKADFWGRRRMAYPIRKQKEGQYMYIKADLLPDTVVSLERNLRFLEPVMRFVISQV
jgi:small subunit ribosomal protein S6